MSVVEQVLAQVNKATVFPVVITNKDLNLIADSALIIQALEGDGYNVETFVNLPSETYGIKVTK